MKFTIAALYPSFSLMKYDPPVQSPCYYPVSIAPRQSSSPQLDIYSIFYSSSFQICHDQLQTRSLYPSLRSYPPRAQSVSMHDLSLLPTEQVDETNRVTASVSILHSDRVLCPRVEISETQLHDQIHILRQDLT